MKRRQFLQNLGLLSGATIVALGHDGWVTRALGQTVNHKLVVIFLRGAVDGLNVVVPYSDGDYYDARPTIALAPPGKTEGVLKLTPDFGLHPALEAVLPLWQQRTLAFVHACGSPHESRSHFDAQDFMESGTPGIKTTPDGWMNRLLAQLPGRNPTQAVNLGETTPRILLGTMPVANFPLGRAATRPMPLDRAPVNNAFDRLYNGTDPLSLAYQEGRQARTSLLNSLDEEMMQANRGAPLALNFVTEAKQLAQLLGRDRGMQLAFLSLGGWDTHVNQGSSQGLLARYLKPLGEGLATLAKDLGSTYRDTTILVMSEFGRTVQENGNRGTDHGHGNVFWVLGGQVQGGQVYGDWRGLAEADLFEGRDLPVTTDFRAVVATVLQRKLKLGQTALQQVFPGYQLGKAIEV